MSLCLLAAGRIVAAQEPADCEPHNLLDGAEIASRGVTAPERANDDRLFPEGWSVHVPGTARFDAADAFVAWDLGSQRALGAVLLQADGLRRFRLLGSLDSQKWFVVWDAPAVEGDGLRERGRLDLDAEARFLRLDVPDGPLGARVSELRVYCGTPDPFPPKAYRQATLRPDPASVRERQALSGKLLVALLGLALLGPGWRRLSPHRRRQAAVGVLLLSAASWVQFGRYTGMAGLHAHDSFHYYLGSKYAPELGYFELYRCVADVEREAGRGQLLASTLVRDLDDYSLARGERTGECRAGFSQDRWQTFAHDVGVFRDLLGEDGLKRALFDHGFNATPVNTAWLRLWTTWVPASPAGLLALTWLDHLQLVAAVALMGWGFGWRAAAVLAVLLGCGGPWDYFWIGGSVLRFTWVLLLCAGLAALGRQRWSWGLPLLLLSGLLRVFPLAFFGAALLAPLAKAWRRRTVDPSFRRALVAAGLVGVVALGLGLSVGGVAFYGEFATNIGAHAVTPAANLAGLPFLLAAQSDRTAEALRREDLTYPIELWPQAHRLSIEERAPLHWAAVLVAVALLLGAAWRGAAPEWCVALAGPVMFAALEMSSYDYMWLAVLVPVSRGDSRMASALLGFVAFSAGVRLWAGLVTEHVLVSIAAGLLLIFFARQAWRSLGRAEAS